MGGYVKLHDEVLRSTVWGEPHTTRIVWITMLVMTDRDGYVSGSVPGLAHVARVTNAECAAALETFMSPDPDSRTTDFEGRRIEKVDGGWRILNYAKYREKRSKAERAEYSRQWMRDKRDAAHRKMLNDVDSVDTVLTEASAEASERKSSSPDAPSRDLSARDPADLPARAPDSAIPVAAAAARAMRDLGVIHANPSHPDLIAACDAGATVDEFRDAAQEAIDRGIARPFPWILRTVRGRRRDAAQNATASPGTGLARTGNAKGAGMRKSLADQAHERAKAILGDDYASR